MIPLSVLRDTVELIQQAHSAALAATQDQVDRLRADMTELAAQYRADMAEQQARADAQAARQLAERDALHLGQVDRLLAQAGMERQLWLERVDAAELRAERVEQRLDQIVDHLLQRQPAPASFWRSFWGRWFGQSKRSDLGDT